MLKQKLAVAASVIGFGALLAIPSLAAPKAKPAAKPASHEVGLAGRAL